MESGTECTVCAILKMSSDNSSFEIGVGILWFREGFKKKCGKSMVFYHKKIDPHFFVAVRTTFKAVLMAVDKTYALQTKCKTCFGGPRMILQAH